MKRALLMISFLIAAIRGFGQSGTDQGKEKTGLFEVAGVKVKVGFTASYVIAPKGNYVYILQQDSRVVERVENKTVAALSIVTLVPFDKDGAFNFVLNLSLKEYKDISTDKDNGFFNSTTPFGVGVAVFPFPGARFFGFTVVANFGRQNRMRTDAIASQFFPIASHPDYGLKVGAPVPEGLLAPYFMKENTYTASFGITLRI